ncbi:MAG: segregation/condensation protein A [Gammaproteobacteria bacterium]|nr:segregation/condensation protein A [Gammaproteobacteria bacterium]
MTENVVNPEAEATQAAQDEMPFAIVHGERISVPPQDLYIPPDALEVFLDAFEGPLDLLLYLIKRQNLDILTLPVLKITQQYTDYISLMENMRLELAAEYLVMAAMLAEIKSRMLLPRPVEDSDEEDPRAQLIRRLQEYERYKKAAEDVDNLPRSERDFEEISIHEVEIVSEEKLPVVEMKDLAFALQEVLRRADMQIAHSVKRETLSIRERMTEVLSRLSVDEFVEFVSLFSVEEGRAGVIVSFIAILELLKSQVIEIVQSDIYAPIYVKPAISQLDEGAEHGQ